ncbi:uncharacterized protein LOC62_07G008979 [Vanrija pseudolonga]|uniref:Uncharacterized protein n=1 Tax=Vanrija pseudolonga TaxID=143232 RepID=A0AAF0YEX5_9TREE|nr:hypothetical protein LOC62_07G008979 [Vanrija pseudolonga]
MPAHQPLSGTSIVVLICVILSVLQVGSTLFMLGVRTFPPSAAFLVVFAVNTSGAYDTSRRLHVVLEPTVIGICAAVYAAFMIGVMLVVHDESKLCWLVVLIDMCCSWFMGMAINTWCSFEFESTLDDTHEWEDRLYRDTNFFGQETPEARDFRLYQEAVGITLKIQEQTAIMNVKIAEQENEKAQLEAKLRDCDDVIALGWDWLAHVEEVLADVEKRRAADRTFSSDAEIAKAGELLNNIRRTLTEGAARREGCADRSKEGCSV